MTWKKFWMRVNALLHDNRTVIRKGEVIEDWEEVQRKQREIEAEQRKKEREILSTWFLREEYLNAGWFKRLLLRIEFVFRDTRGESHIPQIPDHIRMEIARCLLPDIVAYFESEQGQRVCGEEKRKRQYEYKNGKTIIIYSISLCFCESRMDFRNILFFFRKLY